MKNDNNMKKTNKLGIILITIFLIILLPILIFSVIIMIKANMYPDKIPDIFGYKPMIVLSGSMEPSINTGDLVFVKIVDTSTLEANDVIAFRNESDTVTTHRIVEIIDENGETFFKTKGDNNNTEDTNLVNAEDVEGIYSFKISYLGSVLMQLKEPNTLFMILLSILIIGLIWLYIIDKKENKKVIQEKELYKNKLEELQSKQNDEK